MQDSSEARISDRETSMLRAQMITLFESVVLPLIIINSVGIVRAIYAATYSLASSAAHRPHAARVRSRARRAG